MQTTLTGAYYQYWCVYYWKTTEKDPSSEAQLSLPTCTHIESQENILPTVTITLSKDDWVSFQASALNTRQRGTQTKWRKVLVPKKTQNIPNCLRSTDQTSHWKTKSGHPNISSFLPSLHSEHSERGESNDSELPLHVSLIYWHERSSDKWQLNVTRQTSRSSAKKEITSLDQLCLTTSIASCGRCAHNTPTTKHPHFPSVRWSSTHSFLREESLSDQKAFSSAIIRRSIKTHTFTVSTTTQDTNSTNSLRTINSFFKRNKKSSSYDPYFLGTFHCVEAARNRTLSHGSR